MNAICDFSARPVADDGLLDFGGGVILNPNIQGTQDREDDPSGFGQDDGGSRIAAGEWCLDGGVVGFVLDNDRGQSRSQVGQSCRPSFAFRPDDAENREGGTDCPRP